MEFVIEIKGKEITRETVDCKNERGAKIIASKMFWNGHMAESVSIYKDGVEIAYRPWAGWDYGWMNFRPTTVIPVEPKETQKTCSTESDCLEAYQVAYVSNSANGKLGGMDTTYTSHNSCPISCPWRGHGCYGERGKCNMHFSKVSKRAWGTPMKGMDGKKFHKYVQECERKKGCAAWSGYVRANTVGDVAIPGTDRINFRLLEIYKAAFPHKKMVYTYTHCKPTREEAEKLLAIMTKKFVVNISCETLEQVELYSSWGLPCVLAVNVMDGDRKVIDGRLYQKCPNQITKKNGEEVTVHCSQCRKCCKRSRDFVVVFEDHTKGIKKFLTNL